MAAPASAIKLTEGAVMVVCKREVTAEQYQPVVQVVDLKLVNTQAHQTSSERYRLLLSDGTHYQQGMLGTQLNELVKTGRLQKGSIVQLRQYVCNPVQDRLIIIVIEMDLIMEKCDILGEPVAAPRLVSGTVNANPQSTSISLSGGQVNKPIVSGTSLEHQKMNQPHGGYYSNNSASESFATSNVTTSNSRFNASAPLSGSYGDQKMGFNNNKSVASRLPPNTYAPGYQNSPPMYMNRGPIAKNEAPPRIIPISALNPYQGRWTIKARVTAKGELRHYNNPRGDGKVFSFDLLDSDGGEIRATCFNAVADQFHSQIEPGKVYFISKGTLKPAQKNFNHLSNDLEIFMESSSTIQPCLEEDNSIPRQQFHFRPISDVEGLDNNTIVDVIGIVSSINPATSIMRKNGSETQKRTLQLKDVSGRSVELTLWGALCSTDGQRLQNLCDSGVFPVLAVKSARVSDFNGKAVGTISTSQLFVEPEFPEAHRLRDWFEKEGRNTPSVSISREVSGLGRTDARKTISHIKDEKLGTSEKPDWITVSATVSFIKVDNFCYTACPVMIGDRQCNKKVTNNGDGKWRCERCDQLVAECDYRYILQLQIQDHTGLTWVTAFQETGEEIMGISAKNLYYLKYEEQDDEKFAEIIRKVLFTSFIFKLKVKEETYSDEQRVKSTVIKADKVNFSSESRYLLDLLNKLRSESSDSFATKTENNTSNPGFNPSGLGSFGNSQHIMAPQVGSFGGSGYGIRDVGARANQSDQYGHQYNISRVHPPNSNVYCNSCGGTGHNSMNCPSIMNTPAMMPQSSGGMYPNRASMGVSGGTTGECFKCHRTGHWARDCPGLSSIPPAYGSGGGYAAV